SRKSSPVGGRRRWSQVVAGRPAELRVVARIEREVVVEVDGANQTPVDESCHSDWGLAATEQAGLGLAAYRLCDLDDSGDAWLAQCDDRAAKRVEYGMLHELQCQRGDLVRIEVDDPLGKVL